MRIDPDKQRIDVEQGEIGNMDLGLAISGSLDYSSGEPRLALGIAGTRMSVAAMKRLWPSFISPKVHAWVSENILSGTVERIEIATNAPMATLQADRPADPGRRTGDRDFRQRRRDPAGRTACRRSAMPMSACASPDAPRRVTVGRGNVDVSPGRRLTISNGVFEVPDHYMRRAGVARALPHRRLGAGRRRAAQRSNGCATMPARRSIPATSRGNAHRAGDHEHAAQARPAGGLGAIRDESRGHEFLRRTLVMGQKVEAPALRVRADNQGYEIRGDVKINGMPALLEYRKQRDQSEAEVRVAATLDEAGRARLGFDLGRLCQRSGAGARSTAAFRSKAATAAIRSRPT